jgi:hypothetical protein
MLRNSSVAELLLASLGHSSMELVDWLVSQSISFPNNRQSFETRLR